MQETAEHIAEVVSRRVELTTAWIGLLGVVIGAAFAFLAAVVPGVVQRRVDAKRNERRKKLLEEMLNDDRFPNKWRKLETLQHVIGADAETTKRLLLEVGARASEDGKELWGLIKYHPLPGPEA